jgi:transcriptional regulator with XRE-family HTH domain
MKPSRVTHFAPPDIRAIRRRLGQSQTELARMISVSVATLQNWEQGRRQPEGPARALLKVAAINPPSRRPRLSQLAAFPARRLLYFISDTLTYLKSLSPFLRLTIVLVASFQPLTRNSEH